jgi:hypothetical protein
MLRLSEWFWSSADEETLPRNPRAIRQVPPFDPAQR